MEAMEENIMKTVVEKTKDAANGGVSPQQQTFNDMVHERLSQIDGDLTRLNRIDTKMNKELVQKPYQYIDRLKDSLMLEQKQIVEIVKGNNQKYISKFLLLEETMAGTV